MRYWFLKIRKEMKMKQSELANFLNVSQQLISNIENGKPISESTAKHVASEMQIQFDELGYDWTKFYAK